MNLCHDLHAPQHAYNKILNWAQDSKLSGYTFSTNAPSWTMYLKQLYQHFNMHNIKPKLVSSELYPYKQAEIVTFPFAEMFKSLLFDETLSSSQNILRHTKNNNNNNLSDINSGSWYQQAQSLLCKDHNDYLCPIILFIDKTQIDVFGKWSLEPVLFTLGIFDRKTRNQASAWRPLGLVTNTLRSSTPSQQRYGTNVNNIA